MKDLKELLKSLQEMQDELQSVMMQMELTIQAVDPQYELPRSKPKLHLVKE